MVWHADEYRRNYDMTETKFKAVEKILFNQSVHAGVKFMREPL